MRTKTELIEDINNLPVYELKEIFTNKEEYIKQKKFMGVIAIDATEAISIVSKKYKLTQFKEVFLPIIENIDELNGEIKFYKGKGILFIFPEGERFNIGDNKRLGIAVFNSVTKEYAILIDFVILNDNNYIVLPRRVTSFRKKHTGKVIEILNNYEKVVGDIRESWKTISEKFSRQIEEDEIQSILKDLRMGKRINKSLNEQFKNGCDLWSFFIEVIKSVSDKNYRNEINKINKLKGISNYIFKVALGESL